MLQKADYYVLLGEKSWVTQLFFNGNRTKGNGGTYLKFNKFPWAISQIAGVRLSRKGRKSIWQDFF